MTNVPELSAVSTTSAGLTVGAAVSLAKLIDLCHEQDAMSPTFTNDPATETVATATSSFSALARHLLLVANRQARLKRCYNSCLCNAWCVQVACGVCYMRCRGHRQY